MPGFRCVEPGVGGSVGLRVGRGVDRRVGAGITQGLRVRPNMRVASAARCSDHPSPGTSPASFGVPECDQYAAVGCNCSNQRIREHLCPTIARSFASWRVTVGMSPIARNAITRACREAATAIASQCGSGTGAALAPGPAWDGQDTFVCGGSDSVHLTGVTATLTDRPAIRASGNCTVELTDCNITAPVAIQASGNAVVTVTGGQVRGTEHSVSASGNARVNVAATTVSGPVSRSGNATVSPSTAQ